MKKKSCLRWGLGLGILAVALLCVAAIAVIYFQRRSVSFNSRPLVLIQQPFNHERILVGEGVPVHATAREDSGLRRVELWVDDELLAVREPADTSPKNLTLTYGWSPVVEGTHVIVVRAISASGALGQSTITVTASAAAETGPETHTIQEGETVDVIAAEHGVTPEQLAAANPDLASAAPGDELVLPDEAVAPAAAPPAAAGAAAPADSGGSPGSTNPLESLVFQLLPFAVPQDTSSVIGSLRLEVLALQTSQAFDGLHCYVGIGDSTPRWLPDADGDQTTDESFAALGGGEWDVQPSLAGTAAPFLAWPGDHELPVDISCVGMSAGGADALDLGRMQFVVPPSDWDAVTRTSGADGEGGHAEITYKVTRMDEAPRGVPAWLEPGMTPPANVRLDDRRISLRWDYNPRADEAPIDGFRIYLNGNLQWTERADARESGLPYEWFHPLCGSPYLFGVTAFRAGYPDGPESTAATVMVVTPAGQCDREIQVIFRSLETFELGVDGSPDHLSGDVGPVYGNFYANEDLVTFDTRSSAEGGGSLDSPIGLYDNTVYQLNDLWTNRDWNFSSMPGTVVDVPPGGSFQLGFFIMDHDRSRDNLACAGDSAIYYDNPATQDLDEWHEGTVTSEDGKCRLTFSFGPALGSPVGTGIAGAEPLPWLEVEDILVNAGTGAMQVQLRNTGTATWPWRDLDVELRARSGETIALKTWPGFVLEAGQERTIDFPAGTLASPFDACVLLDPADKVPELYERTGALMHGPVCEPLPDLAITGAAYNGTNRLRVTVENVGSGMLEGRNVSMRAIDGRGVQLGDDQSWRDVTLRPGEARVFEIPGIDAGRRTGMQNGYSIHLDPDGTLAETSTENNIYTIGPSSGVLMITWVTAQAPYDARRNVEFSLRAEAVSGESRRQIVLWQVAQHIDWSGCYDPRYCNLTFGRTQFTYDPFELYGDEALEVTIRAAHAGEDGADVVGVERYEAADGWGAGPRGPTAGCYDVGYEPTPSAHQWIMGYVDGHPWYMAFNVCNQQ